jgi:hypothetical protein
MIIPGKTRATNSSVLVTVPIPSCIAIPTTHRLTNARRRLGGRAHAPRDDSLQHNARNHRCSCSQPPRATTAARSLRLACDHARARVQCSNAAPFAGRRRACASTAAAGVELQTCCPCLPECNNYMSAGAWTPQRCTCPQLYYHRGS